MDAEIAAQPGLDAVLDAVLKQSVETQILALAAIKAGGQLRLPLDEFRKLILAPEEEGFVYIDIDRKTNELTVTVGRNPTGPPS